jgi:beta-mannosidase
LTDQKLPSGVYSALEDADITGSVLFGTNDVKLRWIANDNWTYSLKFDRNINGIVKLKK